MGNDLATSMAIELTRQCKNREQFKAIKINEQPINIQLAYDIQQAFVKNKIEKGQGPIVGYKVGLTSKKMQQFCNIGEPIVGRILENSVSQSGVSLATKNYVRLSAESEIVLRIARPVPAQNADMATLLGCIGSIHAGFEIIDDRNADYTCLDASSIVAENAWNAGMVLGEGVSPEKFGKLDTIRGQLNINNMTTDKGISSDVMGGPLEVIQWLAIFLAKSGETLMPGQWVMTGSIVETKFLKVGDNLKFELEGLAAVTLSSS